jgi:hypothetical protein
MNFLFISYIYKVLTTWWDVYETLLHLLFDQANLKNLEKSSYLIDKSTNRIFQNKPKGQSLFLQLPKRDCFTASIPNYLCSCRKSQDINTTEKIIHNGALYLINYINYNLLNNFEDLCMRLKLKRVIDAQIVIENSNKYSIIFETFPSNAVFDAQLKVEHLNKSLLPKYQIVGKITRINTYGMSSRCINNYEMRNFCYCFSYHKKIKPSNTKIRNIKKSDKAVK